MPSWYAHLGGYDASMTFHRGRDAALRAVAERRSTSVASEVVEATRAIVEEVRRRGDAALLDFCERFDGVRPNTLRVARESLTSAHEEIDPALVDAMAAAKRRVERYYRQQPAEGFLDASEDGVLAMMVRPVDAVGIYVPGGSAPLFSSLLMTAVPARVAGVPRIVVASPPGSDGSVPAVVRHAAHLMGIDEVIAAGGAQAIAAMAYGTESLPAVDLVAGPGNDYVVTAKRLVFGTVGIDALPGPTETLVVADAFADPVHAAADLVAQSEHPGAEPALVTWSDTAAHAIVDEVDRQISALPDPGEARRSWATRGRVFVVADGDEAMEVANAFAPEHLCLLVEDPWAWLPKVRNAGGVFLGAHAMEALGDYVAGPSHVMPTGSTARFASFVNVRHFQKVVPIVATTGDLVRRIGPAAVTMARAEGLEAHARAILARLDPARE